MSIVEDMPEDVYLGNEIEQEETEYELEETAYVDPRVDPDYEKKLEVYDGKNEYLRKSGMFREMDTSVFLRILFCRGDDMETLPFEEEWCEAYEWWTEHTEKERTADRPVEHSFVYNGIAQAIYGKRQTEKKNKTFVITSQAERLGEILTHPFVIMSPISYTGKRRLRNNARYLYAIAIDIDKADADNIDNLLFQSDPTRKHITFPQPNIIVNSGNGIHIYYLLETPAPMFKDNYAVLNKIKRELTRRVWNAGTTHENPEKPQFQGNCQGFRLPGTQTKFFTRVTAFLNMNPTVKPYYKIEDLAYGGGGWITEDELALVKKGTYNPSRVTLNQARELYPEWYERRIVQGHAPNRWYIKRDLYDWWKRQIFKHATVGHRYFCLMALSIYAKKCDISEEEFKKDLMDFVEVMDGLSRTQKPEDRFTVEDAMDASAAFQENYCTFPLDDLRAITGVPIERNKTRKFRKQEDHLFDARAIRDARCKKVGISWMGNGRKDKFQLVSEWRKAHPDGTQYACAHELGLSKNTVRKWWDKTEEEAKLMRKWKTEEPHSLGAATNSAYIRDKQIASVVMSNTESYEAQTAETIRRTGEDLADAINYGALNTEELMRAMGVPEYLIPIMKAEFDRQVQTPEFWSQFHQANPHVVSSDLPLAAQQALARAEEEHKKRGE